MFHIDQNSRWRGAAVGPFAAVVLLLVVSAAGVHGQARPGDAPLDLSNVALRTLASGAELIVVSRPDATEVTVNLLFRGGTSADPPRQAGLASLTAQVLTHSTRNRTEQQLAEDLDGIGARLGAAADLDFTTVALAVPAEAMEAGLAILADVVLNPVIPADRLAARASWARGAIERERASGEFQASRAFIRDVYGNHPYGRVETPASLARIDVQDAVRYHRDYFRPNNAVFVVAGDVEPGRVAAALDQRFEGWSAARLSLPTYHGLPERTGVHVVLVHLPGAERAVVRAGGVGPSGEDPGWAALRLVNHVLGADSTGLLTSAIPPPGPHVTSVLARRADVGEFQVRFQSEPESVEPTVASMLQVLAALGTEPVSGPAVERGRKALIAEHRAIRTPQQVANYVAQHLLLGRRRDEIAPYEARLAALTSAEVQEAARRLAAVDGMTIVVAGDATVLYDGLTRFGSVSIRDVEGGTVALDDLEMPPPTLGLDGSGLEPRTWTYRVDAQDWPIGTVTRRLVGGDEPGALRLESEATIGPRRVERQVTFRSATFHPMHAEDRLEVEGRRLVSRLSLEGNRVTGSFQGPGGSRTVQSTAVPGALLGEMVEAALWVLDLEPGSEFDVPVVSQDGTTSPVRIRVRGERRVQVPAGTFEALEVEVVGAGQNQRILVTRERPRFTVKIEVVDQPVVTVLTRVTEGSP